MTEPAPRAQRCSLLLGPSARLDYAFIPTIGVNGDVSGYDASGARTYHLPADDVADAVDGIKAGVLARPNDVVRVETSFAAREYDGLFVAMWLLGVAPIKPHRSRTYKTAIVCVQGGFDSPCARVVWHRYSFSGNLACGLSTLLRDVYGVRSRILSWS